MDLSIVIPIFNGVEYLKKGLPWLSGFNAEDVEVILVDDGSTDGSGRYCDELARMDHKIKVIHQVNQGPSAARNCGLEAACGKWIFFADIDDDVNPEFAKIFKELVKNSIVDLHVFAFAVKGQSGREVVALTNNTYKGKNLGKYLADVVLSTNHGNGFLWNKIYRTSIAKDIAFDNGISMMEDEIFNQHYLEKCTTVCTHKEVLYEYMLASNFNVRGRYIANYFCIAETIRSNFLRLAHKYYDSGNNYSLIAQLIDKRAFRHLFHAIYDYYGHTANPMNLRDRMEFAKHMSESDLYKAFISLDNPNKGMEMQLYTKLIDAHKPLSLLIAIRIIKFLRLIRHNLLHPFK